MSDWIKKWAGKNLLDYPEAHEELRMGIGKLMEENHRLRAQVAEMEKLRQHRNALIDVLRQLEYSVVVTVKGRKHQGRACPICGYVRKPGRQTIRDIGHEPDCTLYLAMLGLAPTGIAPIPTGERDAGEAT